MENQKLKGIVWIAGAAIVAFLFAVSLSWIAQVVPMSAERKLATWIKSMGGTIHEKPCEARAHPDAMEQFKKLVARIYPLDKDQKLPIEFGVLPGTTVNAFAFLGGQIFVYQGLLDEAVSAEELAGVLAHEIEHVRNRHVMQHMLSYLLTTQALKFVFTGDASFGAEAAQMLLRLKFSRTQEEEADLKGMLRLQKANVDSEGYAKFFERLKDKSSAPTLLSDHPDSKQRAELALKMKTLTPMPILTKQEWESLKRICE